MGWECVVGIAELNPSMQTSKAKIIVFLESKFNKNIAVTIRKKEKQLSL